MSGFGNLQVLGATSDDVCEYYERGLLGPGVDYDATPPYLEAACDPMGGDGFVDRAPRRPASATTSAGTTSTTTASPRPRSRQSRHCIRVRSVQAGFESSSRTCTSHRARHGRSRSEAQNRRRTRSGQVSVSAVIRPLAMAVTRAWWSRSFCSA